MSEYPENAWIWDDPMNGGRGWDTEDRGCSKKYLRADTCTPNEECVSKAELRKLLKRYEDKAKEHRARSDEEFAYMKAAEWLEELIEREVMDK